MTTIKLAALGAGLALAACASHASRQSALPAPRSASASLESGFILVGGELGAVGQGLSLYEALWRLRPDVLWRRHGTDAHGATLPVVYLNGVRSADPDVLRRISVARVRKVQFVPAGAAVHPYGSGHEAGAILVTLSPTIP